MAQIVIRSPSLGLFARRMSGLAQRDFDKAIKNGLTRTARKYIEKKKGTMSQDIDRPTAFTRRAYDYDSARGTPLQSRAFVRPKQAKYLTPMEFGELVTKNGKKRPRGSSDAFKDKFGGFYGAKGLQKKWLDKSLARASAVNTRVAAGGKSYGSGSKIYFVARLNRGGAAKLGMWEKKKKGKKWSVRLAIKFYDSAQYREKLGFRRDAVLYGRNHMQADMRHELDKMIARTP